MSVDKTGVIKLNKELLVKIRWKNFIKYLISKSLCLFIIKFGKKIYTILFNIYTNLSKFSFSSVYCRPFLSFQK